jgi:hypothetical protein
MIELDQNESYLIPKCQIHGNRTKVAISTSKRYPQTIGFYCDKCNQEFIDSITDLEIRRCPDHPVL